MLVELAPLAINNQQLGASPKGDNNYILCEIWISPQFYCTVEMTTKSRSRQDQGSDKKDIIII